MADKKVIIEQNANPDFYGAYYPTKDGDREGVISSGEKIDKTLRRVKEYLIS